MKISCVRLPRESTSSTSVRNCGSRWRQSLEGSLASQPNEVVPYKILTPVVEAVKQVVSSRLKLFDAQLTSKEMHVQTG